MADVLVDSSVSVPWSNDTVFGPYWTSPSVGYVLLHTGPEHLVISKTDDSGASWAEQDASNNPVASSNITNRGAYFDQETKGDSGTIIHIAWVQNTENEVHYAQFDTADDTWGTDRIIDSLTVAPTHTDSDVSVTKAKSGRVYVCASGDMDVYVEGTDHSMVSSTDGFATAGTVETSPYSSDEEQVRLLPGAAADTDDICAVVMDTINLDLEFWKYDKSATSWSKTTVDTDISLTQAELRSYKRSLDYAIRQYAIRTNMFW